MSESTSAAGLLARVFRGSLLAAVVGTGLSVAGFLLDPINFFPGYMVGWLFWLAVALGCLAFSMIHGVTGGAWGIVLRPVLESASDTIPLVALAFAPLLFGMNDLYLWTDASRVSADPILSGKADYLNREGYVLRTAVYFLLWIVLAALVTRHSGSDDPHAVQRLARRRAAISGPGLILFGFSVTLASIDWVMSIEPHWYSTMFGVIFMAGQAVNALAFAILVTALIADYPPWNRVASPSRFRDLGTLLLTSIVFWLYVSFMQFLLIWSGNLPEENPYYVTRSRDGWPAVAVMLVGLHFVVPFFCLLFRDVKRNRRALASLAALVLVMRLVDWYWLVAPSFGPPAGPVLWQALAAFVAIGGWWLALFAWRLQTRANWPFGEELLAGNLDERSRFEAH